MKQTITIEQAIKDIRDIFGLDKKDTASRQIGNTFMIIKTEYTRFEVIDKLREYFKDKKLADGFGCCVDGITFVWTMFEFKRLNKEQL